MSPRFEHRSRVASPTDLVFEWHCRPGALERLTPPWEQVSVVSSDGNVRDGRVEIEVKIGPFRRRWVAVHRDFEANRRFRDEQVAGPFARWIHTHRFEPDNAGGCLLSDEIDYQLPFGPLGALAGPAVRRRLERMFRYRHAVAAADLERHAGVKPMTVAITGARGLVGSTLVPFLTTGGHAVREVVRAPRSAAKDPILFDSRTGAAAEGAFEGLDAVVHLAGENIAARRWSPSQKEEIRRSRVEGTRALAAALERAARPPKTLVCASAIGFYGDRGSEVLTEASAPGRGFLADVCQEWERAADAARARGIRVVHLRFGIILTPRGGALAKLLPPFRLGLGGPVGDGSQFMSWVSIEDVVGALYHALLTPSLEGPVNVTAPDPVPNAAFAKVLGRVLRRPAFAPFPAPAVQLAFGEMGRELLLSSQRVEPERLLASGYRFHAPRLEPALRFLLGA